MSTPDIWLDQGPDGRRFAAAIGIGLIVELSALALLMPVFTHQPPPAATPAPVKLTIQAPPPSPKPMPPTPKPPPPVPVVTPPLPVAPPTPKPPPPRPLVHHIVHHVSPPPPQAAPQPQPPAPTAPPAPPVPAAPTQGQVDAFRLAMKNAVQSVASEVYPQAAQMAHETGIPEVTFTYLGGQVTNIALARSSGFPLLDAAALQAARIAHYPLPPAGFSGHSYYVTVEVIFQMAAQSVDGE